MSNQTNVAAQEAAKAPNAPTQYTVSPNTAMFLDLLKGYNELYAKITNAIEEFYGASQEDRLFNRDFYPIMDSLQNEIFEYVKDSIKNNVGNTI